MSDELEAPEDGPRWYGYTGAEWKRLVGVGYDFLVQRASQERDTSYTELCAILRSRGHVHIEPHDHALPHLLGDIATRSYKERGVALTALVRYVDDTKAGDGFFVIAQDLGLLKPGRLTPDEKLVFHVAHFKQVLEAYSPGGEPNGLRGE